MQRRADFIWLADQRVDHSAAFATLRGAPLRREDEGRNRWILARGRFHLDRRPDSATAFVSADGRYKLWINGVRIGCGPARCSPAFQRADRLEAGGALRAGDNVVAMLVHVPGIDLAWYEAMNGGWQPVFGDGGVYFHLEDPQGTRLAAADESWRMIETAAWTRETPQAGWGQDFIEDLDARALAEDWTEAGFDDDDWPQARPMVSTGDPAQASRGWGRVEAFPILLASEIPPPAERLVRPSRLVWTRPVEPRPDLPLAERLYAEQFGPPDPSLFDGGEALLAGSGSAFVRTENGRDTAMLFAFDPYHAGRPCFEIEAQGGEIVELACAEALPGEFGRGEAGDGLRGEGRLGCANVLRYTARPGRQRFEKFGWTAVRALQLVVRNAPDGLRIHSLGSLATHYPADPVGAFECSDALLNRLWQAARHTLLQCMHDAWIDGPGREARQWAGDAVVEFDAGVLAFGSSLFPLHRRFLLAAAEGQRADGLLRMFFPGDIAPEAVTIPDYTLLWIIGAERYFVQSGDLATIEQIVPAIERALAWFDRLRGTDILLGEVPLWHFIEWADLDRRGRSAPINILLAGALKAAASLARFCRRPTLAGRWRKQAASIGRALDRSHWDEERGVYVDSVDPLTGARRRRISQHANALMLLFGLVPRGRRTRVRKAITDVGRLKLTAAPPIVPAGEPFDAETDVVRANTFFAHFVNDALARAGCFDWVAEDLRRLFGPMIEAGTSTLWESHQPSASLCHGFSATPLYLLSTYALGVRALAPGHARFGIAPQPAGLSWARGTTPTVHGPIEVEWSSDEDGLELSVSYPESCRPEPGAVPGLRLVESAGGAGRLRLHYRR
jgi:alpha-L-rhamnosidase